MNATTLRDLSRAYAAGALDRETYRRQRHDLLTRIVAGQLAAQSYQAPEPEQRTVFPYDDDEGDTTQEILTPLPVSKIPVRTSAAKTPTRAMLALLLVAGAAAAYFFLAGDKNAPATAPVASSEVVAVTDPLSAFVTANQWDSPQLQALGAQWDTLDEAARSALRAAPVMRRLTDKALDQIQAENALITLGDAEEALSTQQQLLDLMDRLGVEDARLRKAREAWRIASAEFAHQRVADAESKAAAAASAAEPVTSAAEPVAVAAVQNTPVAAPSAAPARVPAVPAPAPAPAASKVAEVAAVTPTPPAAKAVRSTCKAGLAKTRRPFCQDTLAGIGKGPALVVIPAGQFEMGGEAAEEQPRHTVKLERPFAIGLYEVSAGEFAQFCKHSNTPCPAQPWDNPALPVVNVSWAMATAYAQWLSATSGINYRLPSEAEWEYAARAGSTTAYPFGSEILPTHARYSFKTTATTPLPAADRSVNRNDFKLYHMLGNVREWVADAWQASYAGASADGRARSDGEARRVVRGGSYADHASALRSAARVPLDAAGDAYTGFRVARSVE